MAEHFNYTGRKEIDNHDLHITLVQQGGSSRFKADFDFAPYDFASDAKVFIEAYIKNHLIRFDFGTVGAFAAPESTSLDEFGEEVGTVLYRIKVVADDERKTILGMPRRGIGKRADNAYGGCAPDCILPIGKLPPNSEQVWAMDFSGDYPRLCVNASLEPTAPKEGFFIALVYPAALRSVLEYTFIQHHDGKDCTWADDWKEFAGVNLDEPFPDIADYPKLDDGYRQVISDWIDNVVESFVAGAGLVDKVNGAAS